MFAIRDAAYAAFCSTILNSCELPPGRIRYGREQEVWSELTLQNILWRHRRRVQTRRKEQQREEKSPFHERSRTMIAILSCVFPLHGTKGNSIVFL